jgi:hypothetical protein
MTEARPDPARPDAERAAGRGGEGAAVAEPDFLAARRERAARLSETLELPQFKGKAGWEFTDISGLDLAAFGPSPANGSASTATPEPLFDPKAIAELRQVDAGAATLTGELPEGVIVSSLEQAASDHPALVQKHLGTVVSGDDVFVARNDAGFHGGAFVYIPANVALADPADRDPGHRRHRAAAQDADRDGGERPSDGLGAAPVGLRGDRGGVQHSRRVGRRRQRQASLRLRAGALRAQLGVRHPAGRGRP